MGYAFPEVCRFATRLVFVCARRRLDCQQRSVCGGGARASSAPTRARVRDGTSRTIACSPPVHAILRRQCHLPKTSQMAALNASITSKQNVCIACKANRPVAAPFRGEALHATARRGQWLYCSSATSAEGFARKRACAPAAGTGVAWFTARRARAVIMHLCRYGGHPSLGLNLTQAL